MNVWKIPNIQVSFNHTMHIVFCLRVNTTPGKITCFTNLLKFLDEYNLLMITRAMGSAETDTKDK